MNGISIQSNVFGPQLPEEPLSKVAKGQRILTLDIEEHLPLYVAGEHVGPHPLLTSNIMVPQSTEAMKEAKHKIFI